ncbi:MAG: tripartite tricarboxylate transporter substrate binding protein [Acetobacteraceae bacterium]|nr:tripartite tricarboxylate transporter substrate binding protein [Acetobacteraceae bacterium]MCX7684917.1 tripartite tricarboxylate transporter substrate binding protein [Acetobacteraceae bacterium]MDW8396925.1 tripartite tricarboxylate transporter substrate binding protein [Acetobacteraceae bacterium]
MTRFAMHRRALLAAAPALLAAPAALRAQPAWPDRPIRVIVPFGAGGPTDIVARMAVDHVSQALGQPVVVENRAGAGGNIGTRAVAEATDGHTFLLNASGPMVINQWLYQNMGFDPERSFAAIARLTTGPLLGITGAQQPYNSLGDLIADARRRPGQVNYGIAGYGTVPHLATELLARAAGIEMLQVVYRDTPAARNAVIAGEVALFFDSPAAIGVVRGGRAKALAVTTPERFPPFPDIPTVREAGGPDISAEAWYGLFAPAGTPPERIARLREAFQAALATPQATERLAGLGFIAVRDTPEEFLRFMAAERARWGEVIRAANIRLG